MLYLDSRQPEQRVNDALERVILVSPQDEPLGSDGKLSVHRSGALHRAFSVFCFDPAGDLLLQQRAAGKYHSAGQWANSCCGHPRPGESTRTAATRRLFEEFGLRGDLRHTATTTYRAELDNGLVEHEIAHLFLCQIDLNPDPDPAEISDWRFLAPAAFAADIRRHPGQYAPWVHHYTAHHWRDLFA